MGRVLVVNPERWRCGAPNSVTLTGKEARGKAVRGSEQRYRARLKLGLHHGGLAEMRDGLSRRPTAMAQKCVARRHNAGRSEELKSSEQGGQTRRSEATKCRAVRQKPGLDHVGLPEMRCRFIRDRRTIEESRVATRCATPVGEARNRKVWGRSTSKDVAGVEAHLDHVGLVNMGQGFTREPRTMAEKSNATS